jgi:Spy/CpxP family protein refolding chaperone
MNSTIKYLVSALVLGLASGSPALLLAQDNPTPAPPADSAAAPDAAPGGRRGGNPQQMLERLKDRLNLTDDQVAKVQGILQGQRDKMMALRNDDSLSQEDRRAKAMDLMKGAREQIRAILTPDQQKIFDTMPNMMRGRRGQGGDNAPPPAPANNT